METKLKHRSLWSQNITKNAPNDGISSWRDSRNSSPCKRIVCGSSAAFTLLNYPLQRYRMAFTCIEFRWTRHFTRRLPIRKIYNRIKRHHRTTDKKHNPLCFFFFHFFLMSNPTASRQTYQISILRKTRPIWSQRVNAVRCMECSTRSHFIAFR